MFGYIRAYRPYLRVCELDLYKGVYCGLCKTISSRCGYAATFTLSYDFVFLTLMKLGIDGAELKCEKKRCPMHPIRKTTCVSCRCSENSAFEYSADSAAILTYHKLLDDIRDKGALKKLIAAALLPFYRKPYRRASERYPHLAKTIENAMSLQRKLEKEKCRSIDMASEPTAIMMRAIFRELARFDPDMRDTLGAFGYMLGRYVYLCDALDDLREDFRTQNYNPLITDKLKKSEQGRSELSGEGFKNTAEAVEQSVYLTLGAMSQSYVKLELSEIKPIIDNIVYLGLKNTFSGIKNEVKKNNNNKMTKGKQTI